jgi:polysaccharide deacetylase family sporulation protein PdaB
VIAAAIIVISLLSIAGINAIGVFSASRQLPIYSVDCSGNKAAITFDCAWGADDIPAILAALEKENVKATFFIVGQWAEKFPDKVRMIASGGHDIANHSYSHLRMGVLDRNHIKSEILKCGDKLQEITGNKMDLFRAPYGDYSNNLVETAKELGYFTIQRNVDSLDWRPEVTRKDILERINRKIKPGSIILFHNDTPHTAGILPEIITLLKNRGYDLIPVSRLILREDYLIDYEGRQRKKQ